MAVTNFSCLHMQRDEPVDGMIEDNMVVLCQQMVGSIMVALDQIVDSILAALYQMVDSILAVLYQKVDSIMVVHYPVAGSVIAALCNTASLSGVLLLTAIVSVANLLQAKFRMANYSVIKISQVG